MIETERPSIRVHLRSSAVHVVAVFLPLFLSASSAISALKRIADFPCTRTVFAVALVLASASTALAAAPGSFSVGLAPPGAPTADAAFGPVQVLLFAAMVALVFYVVNWTLQDVVFVNTERGLWGGVVLAAALAGLAATLAVPWFYFGLPLGLLLFGGGAMAYATHRNSLVAPPVRVLGKAHVARLRRRLGGAPVMDQSRGPVEGAGRDIIFMGFDDLPIRLFAADPAQHEANAELERVILEAIRRRASTVGYLAKPGKGEVRMRIDGQMAAGDDVERPAADAFMTALKRLAGLEPAELRRPQEGRLRAVVGGRMLELRIKTAGTVRGEQGVIRIIDVAANQRRMEDLGLGDEQQRLLKEALAQRPGLVVLSSPRDSGLTTTLQACLRNYDRYINNVMMFEPHQDVEIENVQHILLNQEDGPVAAADVRSHTRMEPDVVAFDTLSVPEVARILADAAQEHTVLIGLRAGDVMQALARLGELFGSSDPLADRLQLVVNQRLVRLLCSDCREAYRPNPEFLRKANLAARRVDVLYRPPSQAAMKDGKVLVCPTCRNDRYVSRTGLFELMPFDDEMREMLRQNAPAADLRDYARKLGVLNLQEQGLQLVIEGKTSVDEVLRAIKQEA